MMRQRILVADDNELVRKLLYLMLERDAGWEVAVAQNGCEAIAKAQEFKPDVAILDFAMPDMDGLQIARQVSKHLPSAAIILFTIHDSPEMNFEARQAGVSRVLPKTAAGLPLIKAVEDLLANQRKTSSQEALEPVTEIVSGPACEPVPEVVSELVNESATVIAAPPVEASPEMIRAEGGESASTSCERDLPPETSTGLATETP